MLTINNFTKISGIRIGDWKIDEVHEANAVYRMIFINTNNLISNGWNYPMIEVEIYRDVPLHGVQVVGYLLTTPHRTTNEFTLSVSRKNISSIDRFETLLVLLINHLEK